MLIEKNKLLYRINFIVFNFTYWLILNRKIKIENFKLRNLIQIVIYSSIIPTYIYRITQYIKHLPLQSNFITRANLFTRFNDSYYYQFIYQTIIKTKIFWNDSTENLSIFEAQPIYQQFWITRKRSINQSRKQKLIQNGSSKQNSKQKSIHFGFREI